MAVRVDDVAPGGYSMDRATNRQKKTGRQVRFVLTDQTLSPSLGHSQIESTVRYLGVEVDDAIEIAEKIDN